MKPHRIINLGFLEITLIKRQRPIREFQQLKKATDELKEVLAEEFYPILNWLNKILKKFFATNQDT